MTRLPLVIGDLVLPNRIIYAPLAGCSDLPYRQMVRRYSQSLVYCEMVKMEPLLRNDANSFQLLDYSADMHPIGGQLCGSDPKLAGPASRIIEELGFDIVDLNCGCPVDKVTKDGSGSGLLRHPERIGEMIANMVAAVKIPVTIKIRAGWDSDLINAVEITQIAEAAGAQMIAIHGRTRAQGYSGLADRDIIRAAKQAATTIKVAGNGDIFCVDSALHMFNHTGCDAILLSRGAMGRPWLAAAILQGQEAVEYDSQETLAILLEHFRHIETYRNDRRAALDMRRVGPWYCKTTPRISELRASLSKVKSIEEAHSAVTLFKRGLPAKLTADTQHSLHLSASC